jgi:cell wall-associated NlpC family hydrolase
MIQEVISKAVSHVGYKEAVNNDNIFAGITGQANHQPWCATFVCAVFKEAGYPKLIVNSAAVSAFEVWAQAAKIVYRPEQAKRGDLLLFDFSKSGHAEHIGIAIHDFDPVHQTIETIEGNTSSGIGNQANGDGVYQRTRQASFIRAAIRPAYKEQ